MWSGEQYGSCSGSLNSGAENEPHHHPRFSGRDRPLRAGLTSPVCPPRHQHPSREHEVPVMEQRNDQYHDPHRRHQLPQSQHRYHRHYPSHRDRGLSLVQQRRVGDYTAYRGNVLHLDWRQGELGQYADRHYHIPQFERRTRNNDSHRKLDVHNAPLPTCQRWHIRPAPVVRAVNQGKARVLLVQGQPSAQTLGCFRFERAGSPRTNLKVV